MEHTMENLAKRAVVCHRWEWRPGMLAAVPPDANGNGGYQFRVSPDVVSLVPKAALPNFNDIDTTKGLLEILNKVLPEGTRIIAEGRTKLDALLAMIRALELAP
jgi:hypothetical protein